MYHCQSHCQISIRCTNKQRLLSPNYTRLKIVATTSVTSFLPITVQILVEQNVKWADKHTHTSCSASDTDIPQGADEAIGGSLCVQGADVPDVQEAGHLIRHAGHTRRAPATQWARV